MLQESSARRKFVERPGPLQDCIEVITFRFITVVVRTNLTLAVPCLRRILTVSVYLAMFRKS